MMWRKIDGKENYSVSSDGSIRNDKTGRILKLHVGTCGYLQVMLGRKTSPLYVHRIVAQAYIENPDGLPQVDHINGDKTDNRVENLRWVTVSENCWGYGYNGRIENRKKKIVATNGETTMLFPSRNDAARHFNVSKCRIEYGHIYAKGKMKGWQFKLVEDIV